MKTLPTAKMSPPMLPATSVDEKLICGQPRCRSAGGIGLPRRIYRLTALGRRMLHAWTAFARELAWEVKA